MKGIILAGGTGSRLKPLTNNTNKHLLPIYDKQMICYPIETLVSAGITDIMIICGRDHCGDFVELLGDGSDYNADIVYGVQKEVTGIADALSVAETFANGNDVCVILGDNIFYDDINIIVERFYNNSCGDDHSRSHCHLVCRHDEHPENYGVLDGKQIIEKTKNPSSNLIVTGLYFYTPDVFKKIKWLKPSERNELEITDLNNMYAKSSNLSYTVIHDKWFDCGIDKDHLLDIANDIKQDTEKNGRL